MDWTDCPDVERTPGTVTGAWCVKGTRVMVQGILDNAEDYTPEEIAGPDIYPDLSLEVVRRILAFAQRMQDAELVCRNAIKAAQRVLIEGLIESENEKLRRHRAMTDNPQYWTAVVSLPLPENPTLELLDEAREQVIDYLDWASDVLPELTGPDRLCMEINRAADRLIEISLARYVLLTRERQQRVFSDEALDLHMVARDIK
jgi:uncharacterized protein (DUF433 family)